jgi:hypothetical protein
MPVLQQVVTLHAGSPRDGPLGPDRGSGEQAKVEEVLAATAPLPAEAVAAVEHARERERRQARPHPPHTRPPPGADKNACFPRVVPFGYQSPCMPGSHALLH